MRLLEDTYALGIGGAYVQLYGVAQGLQRGVAGKEFVDGEPGYADDHGVNAAASPILQALELCLGGIQPLAGEPQGIDQRLHIRQAHEPGTGVAGTRLTGDGAPYNIAEPQRKQAVYEAAILVVAGRHAHRRREGQAAGAYPKPGVAAFEVWGQRPHQQAPPKEPIGQSLGALGGKPE